MKVLFICNGNVARSQETEALFNKLSDNGDSAASAGTHVIHDKPIDPPVVEVMQELGYDLSKANRKTVNEAMVHADIIISFKPVDELPDYVRLHDNIEYWDIPDPRQQPLEFHRKVRDEIKDRVTMLVNRSKNNSKLVVGDSDIQGKGLLASQLIRTGETIVVWRPKVLTKEQAKKLPADEQEHYLEPEGDKLLWMQPPERYMNHSCDPN